MAPNSHHMNTRAPDAGQATTEPMQNSNGTAGSTLPAVVDIRQLPANTMLLIQQLLAAIAEKGTSQAKTAEGEDTKTEGKMATGTPDVPESSAQGEARGNPGIKPPYCFQCLTKGHPKEECVMQLSCEICESNAHVKACCPLYKKTIKSYAMTCRYAVDGLGFYYIPHAVPIKNKGDTNAALIRVVEEWSAMHDWVGHGTKDHKAAMIIEGDGGFKFKKVMRKVWVQMTGLLEELRDFPTIWVISTILGVTKDVDMRFTHAFEQSRL
jgi:hypothetical protein